MELIDFLGKSTDQTKWKTIIKRINYLSNTHRKRLLNEVLKDEDFKILAKDVGITLKSSLSAALRILFVHLDEAGKVKIVSIVTNYIDTLYEEKMSKKIAPDQVKIEELEKEWTISQYKPVIDQIVNELISNKNKLDKILEEILSWILKFNNFLPEISNLIVGYVRSGNKQVLSLKRELEIILKDLSFYYDDRYLNYLTNIVELTIKKLESIYADFSFNGLSISLHIYNEVNKILEEKFRNKLSENEQLNSLLENDEESFPFFNEDTIHNLILNGTKEIMRNWNLNFNEDTFSKELEKFHYIDGEESDFRLIIDPFPWYS